MSDDASQFDDFDRLAAKAAEAGAGTLKQHDGFVVLVLVRRPNGNYCAQLCAREQTMRDAFHVVNGWVQKRFHQLFGN